MHRPVPAFRLPLRTDQRERLRALMDRYLRERPTIYADRHGVRVDSLDRPRPAEPRGPVALRAEHRLARGFLRAEGLRAFPRNRLRAAILRLVTELVRDALRSGAGPGMRLRDY